MAPIDLNSFVRATAGGQRAVLSHEGETPVVIRAQQSVWGRVASFLSNVPLLKNIGAIKEYTEKVNIENKQVFLAFISSLAAIHGPRGAGAAVETIGRSANDPLMTKPLTSRLIKSLTDVAKSFSGYGDAKELDKQVVVRIWAGKDFNGINLFEAVGRPGHASVTIKGGKNTSPENRGGAIREHISWVPRTLSDKEQPMDAQSGDWLGTKLAARRQPVDPNQSYAEDKKYETASTAHSKLDAGVLARKELSKNVSRTTEERDRLEVQAKFFPRANQKRVKTVKGNYYWETAAQKVYFPMMGPANKLTKSNRGVSNEPHFMLFGLNGPSILAEAEKAKADQEHNGYFQVSTKDNCASMVLRMLDAGGARNFVERKGAFLYHSVNETHDYAKQVQATIDDLNSKADEVSETATRLILDQKHTIDYAERYSGTRSETEQSASVRVESAMGNNFPNESDSINALISKAKNLVRGAYALAAEKPSHPDSISTLLQANSLIQVCGKMMRQCLLEQEARQSRGAHQ